jgi:DNA-damage-inducible protein D
MKKELIVELLSKFENACYEINGIECWSARELQEILGYSKWDNFLKVIEKAKASCINAGGSVADHFAETGKMIDLAKGAQREVTDFALTRYACYLVAQNGDASKSEIALLKPILQSKPVNRKLLSSVFWMLPGYLQEKSFPNPRKNFPGLFSKEE